MTVHGGVHNSGNARTRLFRNPPISRPEGTVLGVQYDEQQPQPYVEYEVQSTGALHRFFRNTGLAASTAFGARGWNIPVGATDLTAGGASGWEVDTLSAASPSEHELLAIGRNAPAFPGANMVYYEHAAGGFVFSARSMTFGGSLVVDDNIQTIVANAIDEAIVVGNWPALWTADIDAAVNWGNGKVYFFKGGEYIRYNIKADVSDAGYPSPISGNWPGLWTDNIDAIVNWGNGKVYFFSGSEYCRYDIERDSVDPGYPRTIAGNWPGLWSSGIDAAVAWHDGRVYFFKGSEYVRYNMDVDAVDVGYPCEIAGAWPGIWTSDIDAIVNWGNGKVFFFKGDKYIRFDVALDRADEGYPQPNYVASGADANPLLSTTGAAQHDYTNFSTSLVYRGNATRVKRWRNTDGAFLTTTYQYDDLGNIRLIRDPLTHTVSYSYTDSFANSYCLPPTGKTGQAWVSQVTNALSQNLQVVRYACTGLVQAHKDQNDINASRAGTTYFYDLLGRVIQKNLPDGGQVGTSYNDVPPVSNTVTTKITSSLSHVTTTIMDGLGRQRKTQLTSDPDGTTYTRIAYDALGRKAQEWNPTRCDPDVNPSSCSGEPTFGVTTSNYDGMGRVTTVVPPDGTISSNNITTAYTANTATVTDQAGKARTSQTDALGRLTAVFEDPGSSPHLNYETDYQYDVLGNLSRVDQKGGDPNSANWRTRTFIYDSLSRLTSATNPESGTITYTYDSNTSCPTPNSFATLLVSKTDARGVRTCFQYEPLNRMSQKNYSTSDTAVNYFYDQTSYNGLTIANGVGRRTGMSDAAGAEAWNYDSMGRPLRDRRTTNSVTLNTDYTYNLDGSMATEVYPSGRTVTFTTGTAGRPTDAKDTANSINYATAAHYAPPGSLAALNNGASVHSTFIFNSRLQPCWIYTTTSTALAWSGTLCTATASTANLMDRKYNFNLGVADNGNVITINNNRDTNRTQNFTYDALNRIQTAYTTGPNWGESFGSTTTPGGVPTTKGIDAWGNLWERSPITGKTYSEGLGCPADSSNRLTACSLVYDAAGNVTSNAGALYTYDAENRIATAGGATYTYDGDGNRVKKSNGTLYWGAGPLAESDLTATSTSWKEYVFFGGKRVARRDASNASVHYFFLDHLGSTSITTNSTGATLEEDLDYYPYGGIASGASSDHYMFTGKERDPESGLDNFGARYHASSLGRFMTPDWAARPATVPYAVFGDPQSLNLYGYVGNRPSSKIDIDGHYSNLLQTTLDDLFRGTSLWNDWRYPQCICQGYFLPKDPNDVSKNPNWTPDPKFDPHGNTRPGTRQWVDGDGNTLRFDPKDPTKSPNTEGGKDHYHYNNGKDHLQPGTAVPDPVPAKGNTATSSEGGGGSTAETKTSNGPNEELLRNTTTAAEVATAIVIILYWAASALN